MAGELDNVNGGGCCGGSCGDGGAAGVAESGGDIATAVREHYGTVAESASTGGHNTCGVSSELYTDEQLAALNTESQAASAGCGNPVGLADAREGETVLDLGSGGGIDCFLAAKRVGAGGKVIGIDMTPEMVELAQKNAAKLEINNVAFKLGKLESISERDSTVDLIISNCVISLVPEKHLVFAEMFRVLRPGGRFVISDMVADSPLSDETRESIKDWVGCIGGADERETFLQRIREAGFERLELIEDRVVSKRELQGARADISSITVRAFKP